MWMALWATLLGCGGDDNAVIAEYEAAKTAALAVPGAPGRSWTPDIKVELSPVLMATLIEIALEDVGEQTGEVRALGVTITPRSTIEDLVLSESDRCVTCMAIDIDLAGDVDVSAGPLGNRSVPFEAHLALDVEMESKREAQQWKVYAKPRDVRSVSVDLDGLAGALNNKASNALKKWVDEEVAQKIDPFEVSAFDAESMPLRALRVRPMGKGLSLDLLTEIADPGRVDTPDEQPKTGFSVTLSTKSIVGLAAVEAFNVGPMDYDIAGQPTSLRIDKSNFELGLRLWKVGEGAWWRDYRATGKVGLRKGELKLQTNDVEQKGMSEGAAMADPLFFLGEGLIAGEMEGAMAYSMPNLIRQRVGGKGTATVFTKVEGRGDRLVLSGRVEFIEKRKRMQGKPTKGKARFRGR